MIDCRLDTIVDGLRPFAENDEQRALFASAIALIEGLQAERDKLQSCLEGLQQWCRAYPVSVFHEPSQAEWAAAAKALRETQGCPVLDAISASNLRHVVREMESQISEALGD